MDDDKQVVEVIAERDICGKQFRVWGTFDNPLFLAKDVAEWLGYEGTHAGRDMCRNLNKDEKVKHIAYVPRGNGYQRKATLFINEGGLYKAIMKSNKPKSEPFKDWVYEEVLPCIRKHGFYSKEQARLDRILKMANIVENENYMINGGF